MFKTAIRSLASHHKGIVSQSSRLYSAGASNLVTVDVNDKTGIAVVTLNSPPVNSLNLELLTALNGTLDDLGNNRSRGMILTSVMQM